MVRRLIWTSRPEASRQRWKARADGGMSTCQKASLPSKVAPTVAVFAPAHTPAPIVEKLSREIRKLAAGPMGRKLAELGIEPASSTPQELAELLRAETAYWVDVAKNGKILPGAAAK